VPDLARWQIVHPEDRYVDSTLWLVDDAEQLGAILDALEDEQPAPALVQTRKLVAEERDARADDLRILFGIWLL